MPDDLGESPAIAENNVTNELADLPPESEVAAESAPASPEAAVPERDKVQERFDKLTREKYDALRAADTERYQRERLEERLRSLETKPEPVVPVSLPTLEAFGWDEQKYQSALIDYARTQARNEVQSAFKAEREQQAQAERVGAFEKRQQDFIASKPDYAEKVMLNRSLPITDSMAEAIRDSDVGPQVAYYLAENMDKATAIAQMSPMAQAREIGRIEARMEVKTSAPVAVSKAPPPPPSIEGSEPTLTVTPDSPESDKWSAEEWARRRNKQLARKKG